MMTINEQGNMKFNWGHGITIFLVIFVVTMVGVVVRISIDDDYNHELVSENYYEDELKYQEEINKAENAKNLSGSIRYSISVDGITVTFPNDFPFDKVSGIIKMKRPSKKILDFVINVKLDDNYQMLIPANKLIRGKWLMIIDWNVENQEFMYKAKISV
jgi:nitrogen fixation protein FixH